VCVQPDIGDWTLVKTRYRRRRRRNPDVKRGKSGASDAANCGGKGTFGDRKQGSV
jgi:hypothetical protein